MKPRTCCSVNVPSRINKSHCRREIKSRESQFHHRELNEGSNYKDSLYGNLCTIVIKWFRFQFRFRNFCGRSCQRFCNYDFPYRVSDEIPWKIKSLRPTSFPFSAHSTVRLAFLTLILPRSRTGTVWFYTSTSNKRAERPKLYTKSLTKDLKLMYSRLTLVRISINL